MDLFSILPVGESNKASSMELQTKTGLNARQLRREVRRLRLAGIPVCSTVHPPGGYFIPADEFELSRFLTSMDRRGRNTFKAAQSARQILKDLQREVEA